MVSTLLRLRSMLTTCKHRKCTRTKVRMGWCDGGGDSYVFEGRKYPHQINLKQILRGNVTSFYFHCVIFYLVSVNYHADIITEDYLFFIQITLQMVHKLWLQRINSLLLGQFALSMCFIDVFPNISYLSARLILKNVANIFL